MQMGLILLIIIIFKGRVAQSVRLLESFFCKSPELEHETRPAPFYPDHIFTKANKASCAGRQYEHAAYISYVQSAAHLLKLSTICKGYSMYQYVSCIKSHLSADGYLCFIF